MFVTGLDMNNQQVTVAKETFYTQDRTHRLQVDYFEGCTYRGRRGSTVQHPRVSFRIYDAEGKHVGSDWQGFPSMDAAKVALRALSADGKIYDEEGWDGVFVDGEVVLY